MKRNGMHALDFHGPALVEGHLTYLRGTQYVNRVVALCFLPYVGLLSADEIDLHAARFEEVGATLLIVSCRGASLGSIVDRAAGQAEHAGSGGSLWPAPSVIRRGGGSGRHAAIHS